MVYIPWRLSDDLKTKAFTRCGNTVLEDFATFAGEGRVFRQKDLSQFLRHHLESWDTRQDTRTYELIEFLKANRVLQSVTLSSESGYASIERYATPDVSPFELALDLRKHSYLTHSTAVFLHGLTDQIPQTVYVNAEQSPKPKPRGGLTQASLDRAFRARQRGAGADLRHRTEGAVGGRAGKTPRRVGHAHRRLAPR